MQSRLFSPSRIEFSLTGVSTVCTCNPSHFGHHSLLDPLANVRLDHLTHITGLFVSGSSHSLLFMVFLRYYVVSQAAIFGWRLSFITSSRGAPVLAVEIKSCLYTLSAVILSEFGAHE